MNLTANNLYTQLRRLIDEAVQACRELSSALDDETTALAARDTTALEAAVAAKRQMVVALDRCNASRVALLESHGFGGDLDGMEQCLRSCDQDGRIRASWKSLLSLLEVCQRQNIVNGGVVEVNQRQVERALSILSGNDIHHTELYDPKGRSTFTPARRHLAQA